MVSSVAVLDSLPRATAAINEPNDDFTLAAELRRELEWIPLKAMRKERDERYAARKARTGKKK